MPNGNLPYRLKNSEDAFEDALDFATDVFQFIDTALFGAFSHVFGAFTFQTADFGFLFGSIVKLVLADLLADIDKLLPAFSQSLVS